MFGFFSNIITFMAVAVMTILSIVHLWNGLMDGMEGATRFERRQEIREPLVYTYEVINRFPHDDSVYVEGFQYEKLCHAKNAKKCMDVFLESTSGSTSEHCRLEYQGLENDKESTLRRSKIKTGEIVNITCLRGKYFGEGMTHFGRFIYQQTHQVPSLFVYNKDLSLEDHRMTFVLFGTGITANQNGLIMTDATGLLHWIDPYTFSDSKTVQVTDGGRSVIYLTELEWINGTIWSNVWSKDCIAIIDPSNGKVHGWLPLASLRKRAAREAHVRPDTLSALQGIAYDPVRQRIFVTGDLWPFVYEIKLRSGKCLKDQTLQRVRQACMY